MKTFFSLGEWREQRYQLKGSLGFIPTMGALHQGHLSLLERARKENDFVVLSIFVNPTQFDDPKDFEKYPRLLQQDQELLESASCDFLFCPSQKEIYPDGLKYCVEESANSQILCGMHRPGHFSGMLTVVLKLLQIIKAQRAYFGEKDFQQLHLVKGLVKAFFLETEICSCPTVREADGLAMSSRNLRLSPEERQQAALFPKILKESPTLERARKSLEESGFQVDYVEQWQGRRLGAVRLGGIRLIDNFSLEEIQK